VYIHKKTVIAGTYGQFTVTIVSNPAGTLVSGSTNTFDYPILSSVTLTCTVDPSPKAKDVATMQAGEAVALPNIHD